MTGQPLLAIRDLTVEFATPRGTVRAVRGVSLDVRRGECLAVVGESGSGKSQLFLGSFGLLAARGSAGGSVRFDGEELLGPDPAPLRSVLGTRVALVFQDPMNALTPHLTIGRQLTEVVRDRGLLDGPQAQARSLEALRAVRMPDPAGWTMPAGWVVGSSIPRRTPQSRRPSAWATARATRALRRLCSPGTCRLRAGCSSKPPGSVQRASQVKPPCSLRRKLCAW